MFRLLSWFSTKTGKTFTHSCVGVATVAAFGSHFAINGPFLDKIVQIFQAYKYKNPKQFPEKVNILVQEVLSDCTLKEEEKKKLKFFYAVGDELIHVGGTNSPWGAVIGIPFTFEDVQDINFGELCMQGADTIDWIIDGQDLIEALTISNSAKKFALMREIYSCDFLPVLQNASINALCVFIPARIAQITNNKLNTFEKFSFKSRFSFYILIYACSYFFYRCLKDPVKHISSKKSDMLAAETGPEYLEGGIEFYEREMMKNIAMRKFLETAKRKFDERGNEKFFLFAPKLPVSKRLENLQNMKKNKISSEK